MRDRISAAVVYGSVASGNTTSDSDVDLLIVGHVGFAETVKQLHSVQTVPHREINPKLYSPEKWQEARKENSAFIREILMKPQFVDHWRP